VSKYYELGYAQEIDFGQSEAMRKKIRANALPKLELKLEILKLMMFQCHTQHLYVLRHCDWQNIFVIATISSAIPLS
jgi:hypothetical protein